MPVLKVFNNKTLTITKYSNTYQDENNAETIKFILPKEINGKSITDCVVYLNFINQKGQGSLSDLTPYIQRYSDDYYVAEVPMYQMFTHEPGTIQMWIKILHASSQMVAKTNEVSYDIKSHRDIESAIPEQQLSVIDELAMRVDSAEAQIGDLESGAIDAKTKIGELDIEISDIDNKVDLLEEKVQDIIDGDEQITQEMLIAKVQDNKEN